MKARIPGGEKEWLSLLPSAYARDPYVVVVTPSISAAVLSAELKEQKLAIDVCEWDGKKYGLQITSPELKSYAAHVEIFDAIRIPMLPARFIGRVSQVPNKFMCSDDFTPLFLLRDAMHKPYLHVRRHIARLTKKVNDYQH